MKKLFENWRGYLNENTPDQEVKILGQLQAPSGPPFLGRKIVVVQTSEGPTAFYQSTGTGTGESSSGQFLPFGGVCATEGCRSDTIPKGLGAGSWFIKLPKSHPQAKSEKFPKEGSEFYNIGQALSKMNINPQGLDEYIKSKGGPSVKEFSDMRDAWRKNYAKKKGWPDKAVFGVSGLPTEPTHYEAMIINNLLGSLGALKHKDWAGGQGLFGASEPLYVDWQDISNTMASKINVQPDKGKKQIYDLKRLIALYNKYKG
jgi:hypothetical protein